MQFSIKKNQRNSIFIVQARSAIFIPRLFHALCIWYNYNRFSIKYFRSRAIGLNAPRTEYSSATGEYPWVLVPIFAIRQSEAVSAVLISCDIKLPARYGFAIMIGYGDRIRTVVYVSEAGPARLVKPWLNQTLICLLCHRSMPKVKYLKDDRNHSLNSTLQEYNVDIICYLPRKSSWSFALGKLFPSRNKWFVRGQSSKHIFAPNGGYCSYISFDPFFYFTK